MEKPLLSKRRKGFTRSLLDLLILVGLGNDCLQSAYDIILFIHKKFDILLSSGTVYANLYRLERNGLINAKWTERKRIYALTENGKRAIEGIMDDYEKIHNLVTTLREPRNQSKYAQNLRKKNNPT